MSLILDLQSTIYLLQLIESISLHFMLVQELMAYFIMLTLFNDLNLFYLPAVLTIMF